MILEYKLFKTRLLHLTQMKNILLITYSLQDRNIAYEPKTQ